MRWYIGTTTTTWFVLVIGSGVKRVVVRLITLVPKVIIVWLVIDVLSINSSLEAIYEGGGEKVMRGK